MELLVDEKRARNNILIETGIYVRAKYPSTGRWDSVDIASLDKASLLNWLKSRGGDNKLAENVVGILLGHGHLHETGQNE
jgi:hypothetical protein